MNNKLYFFIYITFLFFANSDKLFAVDTKSDVFTITNFKKSENIDSIFSYDLGDNLEYSKTVFDDSKWRLVIADSTLNDTLYSSHKGVVWFRGHFKIDSTLINDPLTFEVQCYGAMEFFIDGKKSLTMGTVSDKIANYRSGFSIRPYHIPFNANDTNEHVIAIRTATSDDQRSLFINYNSEIEKQPFSVNIERTETALEEVSNFKINSIILIFSTIFLVLGIFHFILFLYYVKNRANLYYSLFTLFLFVLFFGVYTIMNGADLKLATKILRIELVSLFFVPLFLLGVLYEIFYKKLLRFFWILSGFIAISLFCYFAIDQKGLGGFLQFLITATIIVEIIRVLYKALKEKKDGAKIFLFGLLLPILGALFFSFASSMLSKGGLQKASLFISDHTGEFVGFSFLLSVNISMTFYLARDFARMNKKLQEQLKEIKSLFHKTIEQEVERKKILEQQNENLEQMVSIRTNEVMIQKTEIENKNRDLNDNLNYARRIQEAILPDLNHIRQSLKDFFIIYKPKDIVSGDFYFFSKNKEKIIIAIADCTGHGVTGAFMSMIGTSLLNQLINENGILEPGKILQELSHGIFEALNQSESNVNDGMDIAICAIDLNNYSIIFAGANRPLWAFVNHELVVIKPTKAAIGGSQNTSTTLFNEHSLQLNKGDTIYLFTDGYADQFGGLEGKKIMSKQFKSLLIENQHLSMNEQELFLTKYMNEWMGTFPQIDDILVAGIRL